MGRNDNLPQNQVRSLKKTIEVFWSKVEKTEGCWLWRGGVTSKGYGIIRVNGRLSYAHRFSYELVHGEISSGVFICHRCDTPRCVNPAHHFLGNHAINAKDRNSKGRQARGEIFSFSKLSMQKAREIRKRYARGESMQLLGSVYGVHRQTIGSVIHNETWKE